MVKKYAMLFNSSKNPFVNKPPTPAPTLIMKGNEGFTWTGSTGAESYQVEKSGSKDGPYAVVRDSVLDNVNSGQTIVSGTGSGWYRVKGRNAFGETPYSEPARWY
jgi:hypothetical protein